MRNSKPDTIAMACRESSAEPEVPSEYYDILLLGRTGQGKSTTGNKLLQTDVTFSDPNPYSHWEEKLSDDHPPQNGGPGEANGGGEEESSDIFKIGGGIESVTSKCKLVSNVASNIRVLDTPGFADSRRTPRQGVFNGNLQIFRSILRMQDMNDLAFSRVLYFLPNRGTPERADGTLQEEIRLIHGFLGDEVFKIMIIVATNRYKRGKPEIEIDEDDLQIIREVFMAAFRKITYTTDEQEEIIDQCPPVIYLPYLETDVVNRIVGTEVLYEKPLHKPEVVEISPGSQPAEELIREARQRNRGRKLQFHDRCIKCSAKLIYSESPLGKYPDRVIINEQGDDQKMLAYTESKCHPVLVPRHSTVVKIVGGILHIATAGVFVAVGKIRGKKFWPGFTNEDELCAHCKKDPSAEPCLKVDTSFRLKTKEGTEIIKTNHSTTLDKIHVPA